MGASGTSAGVTGVAGASVTVAEVASPSRIRGVGDIVCAVGAIVKLALGSLWTSPNTVDEFRQRERSKMPHTASPRREPRVAQPPCMPAELRAACASAQLKAAQNCAGVSPHCSQWRVFAEISDVDVPHAAGAARMRAGVGRPRRGGTCPRAHTSGRASDVRNDFKNYTR